MSMSAIALFGFVFAANAGEKRLIQYEVQLFALDAEQASALSQRRRTVVAGSDLEARPAGAALTAGPTMQALPGQEAMFSIRGETMFTASLIGERVGSGWVVDLDFGHRRRSFEGVSVGPDEVLRAHYRHRGSDWLVDVRVSDVD